MDRVIVVEQANAVERDGPHVHRGEDELFGAKHTFEHGEGEGLGLALQLAVARRDAAAHRDAVFAARQVRLNHHLVQGGAIDRLHGAGDIGTTLDEGDADRAAPRDRLDYERAHMLAESGGKARIGCNIVRVVGAVEDQEGRSGQA